LKRGIKFCFQPGEENTHNGAGKMILDKVIHDLLDGSPKVVHCFGLHITSEVPIGDVLYDTGSVTANSDKWKISIQGKGGHAS
jgi:metal-dependent amidase/aminoacylase/carboxypeptidase family protein